MGLRACPPRPEAVRGWELKGLSGCLCLVTPCCRGSPSFVSHTKLLEDKLRQIKIWDSLSKNPFQSGSAKPDVVGGAPPTRAGRRGFCGEKVEAM